MERIELHIAKTNVPTIIKLVADQRLIAGANKEFGNIDEAAASPLAQKLFYLPFVKNVMIGSNFVAVQRFDIVEWEDVIEALKDQVEEYINSGEPILKEDDPNRQAVSIYAESTPNPAVLKFVANKMLTEGMFEYKNIEEAKSSPLATELFGFPFVKEVFITENYISITKYDVLEWQEVMGEMRNFITEFLAKGNKVVSEVANQTDAAAGSKAEAAPLEGVPKRIVEILDEYIKPAVTGDGGNIQFIDYDQDKKLVSVMLQGACSGCPSSTFTLKSGIENILKQFLPQDVEQVEAING